MKTLDAWGYEHYFTTELDGDILRVEMWSGPADPLEMEQFHMDELAWISDDEGNELMLIFAFGLTNAEWLVGNKGGTEATDWANEIFNEDEWGDGLFSFYGFRSKWGFVADSFYFQGKEETNSSF